MCLHFESSVEATVFLRQRCFFQSVVLGNFYCETWHSFNQLCISTNSTDGGLQAISIVRLKPQYLFVVCQEAAWLQHTFADTSKYPQQSNLCFTYIFILYTDVYCSMFLKRFAKHVKWDFCISEISLLSKFANLSKNDCHFHFFNAEPDDAPMLS